MEPFLAMIVAFGGNFAPRGWARCEGQLLAINQHQALFSLLGTIYGGDGRTTFALPDLRGRTMVHEGSGPGLNPVNLGQRGGVEATTLNTNNLPSHTHTATFRLGAGIGTLATGNENYMAFNAAGETIYTATAPATAALGNQTVQVANAGGSQPFNTRSPYLVVTMIIALQGVFPSRS